MSKLSLYVPKKSHFNLIGKGGSTVKLLQEDFKVKVNIPRKEDESTIVTISGQESDCEACHKEIEHILGFSVGTSPLEVVVLDIPKNKHGAILGSGGSTIKSLQEKTGVTITVPGKNETSSSVTLEGTSSGVHDCQKRIEEITGMKAKVVSSAQSKGETIRVKEFDYVSKPLFEALFFPVQDNSYDKFLDYLSSAKKTLEVCVFTITDDQVTSILIQRHKAGVKVRVITDNDTSIANGSDIEDLRKAGIPVEMDNTSYHMHNKFAVIDNLCLINGSYNWTSTASSKNNENIIVTNEPSLVKAFSKNFENLWTEFAKN